MKKILMLLGGLVLAFLVAVISIPLFVDVDQYRPQILAEANKRINGKLELGKLKLSLWGGIKINAESISLRVNGFSDELLNTKEFHIELPFFSLLSGKPQVIAVASAPKIFVTKLADGRMNVMELMKTTGAAAPAPTDDSRTGASAAPAGEPTKVPALIAGASLGIKISSGQMQYKDIASKATYSVNDLDLSAKNLGLGRTMEVDLKAPLKGETPTLRFEGPVTASMELTPVLVNGLVKSAKGEIEADATKLMVEMKAGTFRKTAGMTLTMKTVLDGNETEMIVKNADLVFHDIKLSAKGRATVQPFSAKMEINSEDIRLEKVEEFVPMAKAYGLKGVAKVTANVDAAPAALKVNGDLKLNDGSVFMKEFLKEPLKIQLQAGFSENSLNIMRATVLGPDSDLQLQGNVKNFLAPQFTLSLTGKSFNVDKALVLPPPAAKTALHLIGTPAYAAPAADTNPMLALAANPIMAKATGAVNAQLGRFVAYGAELTQVSIKAQLQAMTVKLQEASFRTFGGGVKSTGEFDLKSPALVYKTQGSGAGISAKEAMTAYFPRFKNTLEGKVSANWNVSGGVYPAVTRLRTMRGTAKVLAEDGVLRSVDFQDQINGAMQKVPFLKNKSPIKIDDGFKKLEADMKFDGGTIRIDPIDMQPRGRGLVIKGKSTIQENLEQDSYFDVFDPNGVLPKEISTPGKASIALHLTGPIMAPKTDWEYTVKRLASTAGKAAAKGAVEKILEKQGGKEEALKNIGDKLKKKFKLF